MLDESYHLAGQITFKNERMLRTRERRKEKEKHRADCVSHSSAACGRPTLLLTLHGMIRSSHAVPDQGALPGPFENVKRRHAAM